MRKTRIFLGFASTLLMGGAAHGSPPGPGVNHPAAARLRTASPPTPPPKIGTGQANNHALHHGANAALVGVPAQGHRAGTVPLNGSRIPRSPRGD